MITTIIKRRGEEVLKMITMKFSTAFLLLINTYYVCFMIITSTTTATTTTASTFAPTTQRHKNGGLLSSQPALTTSSGGGSRTGGCTSPRSSSSSALHLSLLPTLRGGAFGEHATVHSNTYFVGKISKAFKLLIARSGDAWRNVDTAFHISELIPLLILSFLPEIVLRAINNRIVNKTIRRDAPLDFEDTTHLAPISARLCQIGQLGVVVYFGEMFMVYLSGLGVTGLADKPKLLASVVYGVWFAKLVSAFKTSLVDGYFRRNSTNPRFKVNLASRKTMFNNILDAAIYLVTTLILLETNHIDVGVAFKSLLTLGGVSSVVVGLALKEPITEIIQGTSMLLSNKFSTGDIIKLSDGTSGQVQDMKWTDVMMRGSDNSFVRIPHTQLAKQRIINLSRMPCSQVSQKIYLPNKGATKIKSVLDDIKNEIRKSCPKLIDDGTERFLVHWSDIEKNGDIVVSIETHFRIPRLGTKYDNNRQEVLMAITRAVDRYKKD